MKRKNVARNALFTSMISLLLCVSMLVGTTFAWFTDEVTSAGNIIKSGTLDVELYWADGTKAVPTDAAGWTDASKGAIFNYTLWEPGYTEVRHIKIANEGTLALKYQLMIRANGEVSKLADVIDVYFTDPAAQIADRTALVSATPVGTLSEVLATMPKSTSGTLLAGKEATVTLALKMQESAGNEYQDLAIGTNFSVVLVATQLEAENDSFGDDYDIDAWHTEMEVQTASDLQAAVNNADSGTKIVLMDDVTLDEPLVIPALDASTYSLRSAPVGIGLDLNGKTITTAYDATTEKHQYAIDNYGSLVIYGGTIEARGIYNQDGANLTVNGTKIVNLDTNGGSSIWSYGGNVVLNNAELIGNSGCVYSKGNLEINGGTYTCYSSVLVDGTQINPTYNIRSYGDLVINSGNFTSRHGLVAVVDGDAVINGGTYTMNSIGVITSHVFYIAGDNSNVTVNNGTFNCDLRTAQANGSSMICVDAENVTVNVKGGSYNLTPASYVADGYEAVESNGKYIVVSENAIATSDDLIAAINAANDGDTLLLAPGEYSLRFTNDTAFNVDNLNIKGMDNAKLTVSSSEAWYGRVQGDNVTFENIHFTSSVGATGKATYKNCTFDNWTICASSGNKETYFNNCDIKGTLNTSTDFSSGNTYVTDSTVAKAEFSGAATMCFTNCQIGELISWDMATVLKDCTVEKQDLKMENNKAVDLATDESGVTYATDLVDKSVKLYDTSRYTGTTLTVPASVTGLGNAVFGGSKIKSVEIPASVTNFGASGVSATGASGGAFKGSDVEKVVLSEGMTEIPAAAFNGATKLTSVNIPATVEKIGVNAFRSTALTELVIPGTVKEISYGAFRDMDSLETVTINGSDVTLPGYVFRDCSALRTVYLNVDKLTLNGGMNFANASSNNPGTNDITFYVKNTEVADAVKAEMGVGSVVKIYVNDKLYAEIK